MSRMQNYNVIDGPHVVKAWTKGVELDEKAAQQLRNVIARFLSTTNFQPCSAEYKITCRGICVLSAFWPLPTSG